MFDKKIMSSVEFYTSVKIPYFVKSSCLVFFLRMLKMVKVSFKHWFVLFIKLFMNTMKQFILIVTYHFV